MHSVTYHHDISAAHRLVGYPGPCGCIHGHNYHIEVTVPCPDNHLDDMGMIIDFRALRDICGMWLDENWDHRLLLAFNDPLLDNPEVTAALEQHGLVFMPENPTAENMAHRLYMTFTDLLRDRELLPPHAEIIVTVRETRKGEAKYTAPDEED